MPDCEANIVQLALFAQQTGGGGGELPPRSAINDFRDGAHENRGWGGGQVPSPVYGVKRDPDICIYSVQNYWFS